MDDRISDLPDCVLFYILSFLPTKAVVATSVLSKRWKHIWRSVTNTKLELRRDHNDFHQFHSYLDSSHHHHLVKSLKTFIFRCCSNCFNHNNFLKLVTSAALNRLENLHLTIIKRCDPSQLIVLPSPLFNSRTLVVLKLSYCLLLDIQASSTVHLPSLKILSLSYVGFTQHSLLKLLYGCPNLEELQVLGLDDTLFEADIKILPKLVRAEIDLHGFPFELIYNVQFLYIHRMEELASDHEEFVRSSFHNLTHIELAYAESTKNWFKLLKLLNHCPQLQSFVINQYCDDDGMYGEYDWQYPEFVPECISSQLKKCSINGYHGYKAEFEFAKYIMENARQLRYMAVGGCIHLDSDDEDEYDYDYEKLLLKKKLSWTKELSLCTKLSSTCEILCYVEG